MKFRAKVELGGKTATGIEVPAAVVARLGSSKRPAVSVTINGHTYRSTIAAMEGRFMLPVSADVRRSAAIAAGDTVDVNVEIDSTPREVSLPPDFMRALNGEARARKFFDGLSYSNKRRFVMSIEDARTPETRERRIAKAVSSLREGRT